MPGGTWGDLMNIPMTAHFIGGCAIGDSPQTGVIDPYHRLYGYPGLHVVDGSALSANLGVNPSLSITAQAERAMSLWPNRGDARPPAAARRALPATRPRVPGASRRPRHRSGRAAPGAAGHAGPPFGVVSGVAPRPSKTRRQPIFGSLVLGWPVSRWPASRRTNAGSWWDVSATSYQPLLAEASTTTMRCPPCGKRNVCRTPRR